MNVLVVLVRRRGSQTFVDWDPHLKMKTFCAPPTTFNVESVVNFEGSVWHGQSRVLKQRTSVTK